jgi:outer membrane lipoprotein-sorting protein
MTMLRTLSILLLSAACAGPLSAATGGASVDPDAPGLEPSARLERLVERTKAEQAKMRTLSARFVQRRVSALLAAPEESRGQFLLAVESRGTSAEAEASRVRWEYASPKPMTVVIAAGEMTTWYQDLGRAERVKVGRYADQVFKYLGAGGSIESLYQYFDVAVSFPADATTPYELALTPRYTRMKKRLAGMTIWVDRQLFLPTRFRYLEADGDSTEYEFSAVEINRELPPDAFDLTLPEGVEVREVTLDRDGKAGG